MVCPVPHTPREREREREREKTVYDFLECPCLICCKVS